MTEHTFESDTEAVRSYFAETFPDDPHGELCKETVRLMDALERATQRVSVLAALVSPGYARKRSVVTPDAPPFIP